MASGFVFLARGRQPACLVCLASPPFMLRENSKTRRTFWRVDGKAEDAGLPPQVKDDNAASGVSERPTGMCPLVS